MPVKDPDPYPPVAQWPPWQKCPVCFGKGIVPHGFYDSPMINSVATDTTPDQCRACHGRGMVR